MKFDLSELSDVVKYDVVKKIEYSELVIKKINNINTTDTNDLVKKLSVRKKLIKLKSKLLIMIIGRSNIQLIQLILKNLIS